MKKYNCFNNVLGWITFLVASAVYLLTIEPTVSFWDCGEFISSAYKLEVGHAPGAPFFMLTGNLFSQFASSPAGVAMMVNAMSALCSGLTILFLFWSITHLVRKMVVDGAGEMTAAQMVAILGSGLVGALVFTFSDTFWFSAVEGEVYAYSSLFTAVVFWLILKWEDVADKPHADRWIVLIAYLMGLSIGVHLLNLLCIPAIVLVYYYKKFPAPTVKGAVVALGVSFAIVGLLMYGLVQGLVEVCGWFELLFVNVLGMPYNSGVFAYIIILMGTLGWAIYETMRDEVRVPRMKAAFILSVVLLGIPFIGNGYVLGAVLVIALCGFMYWYKDADVKLLNTILICLMVIVVGYSSYATIMIRSSAGTPMDQNSPKDILSLRPYLTREQYGERPLFYGMTYASEVKYNRAGNGYVAATKDGAPAWTRVIKKDKSEKNRYYIPRRAFSYVYEDATNMFFTRMYSQQPNHVEAYKKWGQVKGKPVRYMRGDEPATVTVPTFAENLRFFFSYQLNYMYWRYFMWNFSGRQNDIQGNGEVMNGNWITGIKFIDAALVGPQEDMPYDISHNKGHNVYFMLPLLLGIIGLLYQLRSGRKGAQCFWITFFLFFMTGIAIVLYLNQTPFQPRERDYAYVGSFYAFCIWVGFGIAGLSRLAEKYLKAPAVVAGAAVTALCLAIPLQMAAQNWDDHDRSGRYVARDFGSNYLESCEPNAILFTQGDNDTFPLWYAQEVEGIRTDVRVCNTSYLQTDWYIDQMKRQCYESEALPITFTKEQYVMGKRDVVMLVPVQDVPSIDLRTAMDFVKNDDPKYKKVPGINRDMDYIPSKVLTLKVDSLNTMRIDLGNREVLNKFELVILDMLMSNNWRRPMYYAITVNPDQYVNLDGYFRQTGMTHQIVPFETKDSMGSINAEKMYDNVMDKFKWGGMDKPGVYVDEQTMKLCKSYRIFVFGRLSSVLIAEGRKEKAKALLDKAMQVLPAGNIPLDYTALTMAENYYAADEPAKAEELYTGIAEGALRNLRWFNRLKPSQLNTVTDQLRMNVYTLQEVMRVTTARNPEFAKKYQEEYNNIRKAYAAIGR